MSRGQDKKKPRTVAEMDRGAICKMCGGSAAVSAAGQKEESEERACKPDSVGGGHFSGEPITRLLVGLIAI